MKGLCLLVVLLYTSGSIRVECYECKEFSQIIHDGPVIGEDCQRGAVLLTGDLNTKCRLAKADVMAKGVQIRDTFSDGRLMKVGLYSLWQDGVLKDQVVALLVHDNPIIILSRSLRVYFCKT